MRGSSCQGARVSLSVVRSTCLGLAVLFAVLGGAPAARAQADGVEPITLRVGQTKTLDLGFLPAQIICDDLNVLEVRDARDRIQLVGKTAGRTLCSFRAALTGFRRVFEVTVTAAIQPGPPGR